MRPTAAAHRPSPPAPGSIDYQMATVDAPDAYYSTARVNVDGVTVTVMNRGFEVIGVYMLDEAPDVDDGPDRVTVGSVDDIPLVVRRSNDCGCHPTQKVIKENPHA